MAHSNSGLCLQLPKTMFPTLHHTGSSPTLHSLSKTDRTNSVLQTLPQRGEKHVLTELEQNKKRLGHFKDKTLIGNSTEALLPKDLIKEVKLTDSVDFNKMK